MLGSARGGIDHVVERLLTLVNVRSVEAQHKDFDATQKQILLRSTETALHNYYKVCFKYAADMICKEAQAATSTKYTVKQVPCTDYCHYLYILV